MSNSNKEKELVKPKAIQAFEKRFAIGGFAIEAERCEDVFFLRVASSWEEFFRTAFCFINDSSLKEENLRGVKDLPVSLEGVTLSGELLFRNIWGSECILAQGQLRTPPASGHLITNLLDGVYLLSWFGSDSRLD